MLQHEKGTRFMEGQKLEINIENNYFRRRKIFIKQVSERYCWRSKGSFFKLYSTERATQKKGRNGWYIVNGRNFGILDVDFEIEKLEFQFIDLAKKELIVV